MQLLLIKIILRDLDSHIQIEKRPCVDLNHQPFGQQPPIFYITLKDSCVRMQLLVIKITSEYNIYNFDILYAFLSLSHKKFQYQNYF